MSGSRRARAVHSRGQPHAKFPEDDAPGKDARAAPAMLAAPSLRGALATKQSRGGGTCGRQGAADGGAVAPGLLRRFAPRNDGTCGFAAGIPTEFMSGSRRARAVHRGASRTPSFPKTSPQGKTRAPRLPRRPPALSTLLLLFAGEGGAKRRMRGRTSATAPFGLCVRWAVCTESGGLGQARSESAAARHGAISLRSISLIYRLRRHLLPRAVGGVESVIVGIDAPTNGSKANSQCGESRKDASLRLGVAVELGVFSNLRRKETVHCM